MDNLQDLLREAVCDYLAVERNYSKADRKASFIKLAQEIGENPSLTPEQKLLLAVLATQAATEDAFSGWGSGVTSGRALATYGKLVKGSQYYSDEQITDILKGIVHIEQRKLYVHKDSVPRHDVPSDEVAIAAEEVMQNFVPWQSGSRPTIDPTFWNGKDR